MPHDELSIAFADSGLPVEVNNYAKAYLNGEWYFLFFDDRHPSERVRAQQFISDFGGKGSIYRYFPGQQTYLNSIVFP